MLKAVHTRSSAASAPSATEMQQMRNVIDVQVSASILANENNERTFGRRVLAVLPEVHAEAERAYVRALRESAGSEIEYAKASALQDVSATLEGIFRRHDLNEKRNNLPANKSRTERQRRRRELLDADHHVRITGGRSAANPQLQALLSQMDERSRNAILAQCTNPDREGESLHLLVTTTKDRPHPRIKYRLFRRNGNGVGHGAGADNEATFIHGATYME